MAACCIGGVCIPYSAVWPLVMFALKYIWDKFGTIICRILRISSPAVQDIDLDTVEPSEIPYVKSATDWQRLLAETKNQPLIVDFTASWCRPCAQIAPFFGKLSTKYTMKSTFVKVDIDELDDVAAACKVSAVPTFQAYVDGRLVDTLAGASESKLYQLVDHIVAKTK